jgi:flagellar P-ring protein precursor FlgI
MKQVFKPSWLVCRSVAICLLASLVAVSAGAADENRRQALIRDITSIEGVRDNMLVGYGLVVGLNRTGDSLETYFTVQTLANAMQKMGVLISPTFVQVRNVAAVFVTASLPPFARPGAHIDVTISSTGDAKSLEGGVLLMSALHGPDGQIYAEAQGPLVVGGYTVGNAMNGKEVNVATVGRIPNGGIVERDTSVDLHDFRTVSLLLRNPDFTTAQEIASVVNRDYGKTVASVLDSSRVDVNVAAAANHSVPELIAKIQNLSVTVSAPARVVINERTGTIALGGDVKLAPVSVIHGNLSISVATTYLPEIIPGQKGQPQGVLVPQTNLNVNDPAAQTMRLDNGANVGELVNGLHALSMTAHDVISILQVIKEQGGLQAELEVQ